MGGPWSSDAMNGETRMAEGDPLTQAKTNRESRHPFIYIIHILYVIYIIHIIYIIYNI